MSMCMGGFIFISFCNFFPSLKERIECFFPDLSQALIVTTSVCASDVISSDPGRWGGSRPLPFIHSHPSQVIHTCASLTQLAPCPPFDQRVALGLVVYLEINSSWGFLKHLELHPPARTLCLWKGNEPTTPMREIGTKKISPVNPAPFVPIPLSTAATWSCWMKWTSWWPTRGPSWTLCWPMGSKVRGEEAEAGIHKWHFYEVLW